MTSALRRTRKKIVTFLGARTRDQLIVTHLDNINRATDDGSAEFHGTVVDLLAQHLNTRQYPKPKIFACGPNPMLYRLSQLAEKYDIPCEMSLESAMACGVGLCQGCPVETRNGEKKYALICTAGPVFDSRTIRIA